MLLAMGEYKCRLGSLALVKLPVKEEKNSVQTSFTSFKIGLVSNAAHGERVG